MLQTPPYKILQGDCRETLRTLPDCSIHCCVTSPPYFGLRDYGCEGQIGLEPTPDEFVAQMVAVFREVRRVLRDDGTLWLNLGDSYANPGGSALAWNTDTEQNKKRADSPKTPVKGTAGYKPKDLMGIPWRVAFALQADGWYLRQEIIWHKPNPMPESVTDRCTKSHEQIFLLAKSQRYYFDAVAIQEQAINAGQSRSFSTAKKQGRAVGREASGNERIGAPPVEIAETRNKRSVWTVSTKPYKGAHFATFPPDLIEPCILAGTSEEGCCSECGAPWVRTNQTKTVGWEASCKCEGASVVPCTVLDPFGGSGTTAQVAIDNGCHAILCELNPEYVKLQRKRLEQGSLLV